MSDITLHIGSANLSSWSLRAWLVLSASGLDFETVEIALLQSDTEARIARVSPSGRVPVLRIEDQIIWDSLAIAETIAELVPTLWPENPRARARGRAISAEMHSGFPALRAFMPMDFVARFGPPGRLLREVEKDIVRIEAIWGECLRQGHGGGPFLFGRFTIADAMFAPVCSRFVTYAVALEPELRAYVDAVMGLPAMRHWHQLAQADAARFDRARAEADVPGAQRLWEPTAEPAPVRATAISADIERSDDDMEVDAASARARPRPRRMPQSQPDVSSADDGAPSNAAATLSAPAPQGPTSRPDPIVERPAPREPAEPSRQPQSEPVEPRPKRGQPIKPIGAGILRRHSDRSDA